LWHRVLDFVSGPRLLRFSLQDKNSDGAGVPLKWRISATEECGPDGFRDGADRKDFLLPAAPRGALIGKVGGSTADLPETSPPSREYSALAILFSASAACQRTCSLPPLRVAVRAVIFGGVLSIINTGLSFWVVSASAGGLLGASDAVIRRRYSPSGKAVESH